MEYYQSQELHIPLSSLCAIALPRMASESGGASHGDLWAMDQESSHTLHPNSGLANTHEKK